MTEVVFVLTADSHIGSGHLVRCSRLAKSLEQCLAPCRITFLLPSLEEVPPSLTREIHAVTAGSMDQIPGILERHPADILILDCYALDAEFERRCLPGCRLLAVIDDLHNRPHACHVLVDGNPNASAAQYRDLVPPTVRMLLGGRYVLIAEDFRNCRKTSVPASFSTGLVCFGGADPVRATGAALRGIAASPVLRSKHYTVISGALNPEHDQIRRQIEDSHLDCTLLRSTNQMARMMQEHDFAIGACGGMGLERLCVGIPSVHVKIADNQIGFTQLIAGALAGVSVDLADLPVPGILEKAVLFLEQNGEQIRQNSQTMVDGRGMASVAAALRDELARRTGAERQEG